MAVVEELLRAEEDGTISFGNHKLETKAKAENFEHAGDLFKVKTYKSITKLEKNGMFTYESVPGTSVNHFEERENGVEFIVEGDEDAQITIGLEEATDYDIFIDDRHVSRVKTNLGGKLNVSVELAGFGEMKVTIAKEGTV